MGEAQKSHLHSIGMIAPSLEIVPYENMQHIDTGASAHSTPLPSMHSCACLMPRPSMAINVTAHEKKPDP